MTKQSVNFSILLCFWFIRFTHGDILHSFDVSKSDIVSHGWHRRLATKSFSYTGSVQTWTVPDYVTSISMSVIGAAGGDGSSNEIGGGGGRVVSTFAVVPGTVYNVYVGEEGAAPDGSGANPTAYNGGIIYLHFISTN